MYSKAIPCEIKVKYDINYSKNKILINLATDKRILKQHLYMFLFILVNVTIRILSFSNCQEFIYFLNICHKQEHKSSTFLATPDTCHCILWLHFCTIWVGVQPDTGCRIPWAWDQPDTCSFAHLSRLRHICHILYIFRGNWWLKVDLENLPGRFGIFFPGSRGGGGGGDSLSRGVPRGIHRRVRTRVQR